jgi:hypothetical protein
LRTDPSGPCPAAIAILGLYPAHVRTEIFELKDGTKIPIPVEVERRSFVGSSSAQEIDERYLRNLGITRDDVFCVDLYPYFLANTAVAESGRSMWDNVEMYAKATGEPIAIKPRPRADDMLRLCRELRGNAGRLADFFARCQPRLLLTLGKEAAAFVRGDARAADAQPHLYEDPAMTAAFGPPIPVVHLAHPGIFSRGGEDNPWIARHDAWCQKAGRELARTAKQR